MKIKFFDNVKYIMGDSDYLDLYDILEPEMNSIEAKWANISLDQRLPRYYNEKLAAIREAADQVMEHNRSIDDKKDALWADCLKSYILTIAIGVIMYGLFMTHINRHWI